MRKTIKKLFWVWQFEKEEAWLNEMAAKGLCLVSVGFCRYQFEDCSPGEYAIRMELLEHLPANPEAGKYIEFIESTGAEQVGSWQKWVYFRKKTADGAFELFSDNASRIKHLTRIMRLILFIGVLNLWIGAQNLLMVIFLHNPFNGIGFLNLALGGLALFGFFKLRKQRNRLRNEQRLFE